MKRKTALAFLAAFTIVAMATPLQADRYDRTHNGHPLRLVAYILHPVGMAIEYGFVRPIHWVVSQNELDVLFGHQPHIMEDGTYFEYLHGDYTPTIGEKRLAYSQDGLMPQGFEGDGSFFGGDDDFDTMSNDSDTSMPNDTFDSQMSGPTSMDPMPMDAPASQPTTQPMSKPMSQPSMAPMTPMAQPQRPAGPVLDTSRVSDTARTN